MKIIRLVFLLFSLLIGVSKQNLFALHNPQIKDQRNKNNSQSWKFQKQKGTKLVFKEGTIETNLFDLKYIGQVPVDDQAPFLIFSGRYCKECDAKISLYFHSPRNGKLEVNDPENSIPYPKIEKSRDGHIDNQIRAFYGEISNGVKGFIYFRSIRVEGSKHIKSVEMFAISGNQVIITGNDYRNKLDQTLELNKSGKNKEIKQVKVPSTF